MNKMLHTFIVLAYKKSPYLECCLDSLAAQTVKSRIIVSTSTPDDSIREACTKRGLKLFVNPVTGGIAPDWNFACGLAETDFFTLAHQDDLYEPDYAESVLKAMKKAKDPLIAFSDYSEKREEKVTTNGLPRIKRLMLIPARSKLLMRTRLGKRLILAFGNAVCCPSVTYCRERFPKDLFDSSFRSNMDWMAWEELSKHKGSFVYIPRPLMEHRIHMGSTTSGLLEENGRSSEDLTVFRKFWPEPIAKLLTRLYKKGEKYNQD